MIILAGNPTQRTVKLFLSCVPDSSFFAHRCRNIIGVRNDVRDKCDVHKSVFRQSMQSSRLYDLYENEHWI